MTDTTVKPASPAAARTRLMLEGPIVPTLLRLAVPNLVVNVVLIAVTTSVDAHFIGRLGLDSLAGLALVFPLLMLMQQMANMAMGGAIAASIARAIGAGRREDAASLVIHALAIAAGAAALFSAVFLLGGPAHLRSAGRPRPDPCGGARIFQRDLRRRAGLLAARCAHQRGAGNRTGRHPRLRLCRRRDPAYRAGAGPRLRRGPVPALGITGAGLATVISFIASIATLAWYLASGRTSVALSLRGIRFERRLFGEILRVGAPMSLAPVLNNVALATLTTYAGLLGATSLAAFGAAVRLEYLLYPLNFGLGAAVLAMVGSNIGARQFTRAARIAWTAVGLSACVMASVSVLAIAAPDVWMGLFSRDPAILAAAAGYLAVVGLAYPFVAVNTLMSAFQATRQPEWPLAAMTCRLLVVVLGGWVAIEVLHAGLVGLGLVTALGLASWGIVQAVAFRLYAHLR